MSNEKNKGGDGDISFDERSGKVPETQGEAPAPSAAGGYYQSATTPTGATNTGYYNQVSQSTSTVAEGLKSGPKSKGGKNSGKVSQSSSTMAEGLSAADKAANIQALVGRTIDRYRIIKLLGEGGFGAVYMAEHTLMKRNCAFKTLHKELGKDPAVLHRFKKEGQVSSKFKHKNCIELYDFGQMDDGTYFMAMEFLPGKDLRDILKKRGALELGETFDIMIQSLSGLQGAHDGGVIHRDLKPDNIKLEEREGRTDFIKILDFGIAKIIDSETKLDEQTGKISAEDAANMVDDMGEIDSEEVKSDYKTQVGAFFGTPEYGSPEQCAGEEIDGRSDLYTMGVILYECLTGSLPFVSKTPQGYLAQHMVAPPRPISEIRPDLKIPLEVESLIMKALEKSRDDRFQSCAEFAQAMIDVAHEIGIPITVEGGGTIVVKTPMWKLMTFVGVPVTALAMTLAYVVVTGEDPIKTDLLTKIRSYSVAYQLDDSVDFIEASKAKPELAKYKVVLDEKLSAVKAEIASRKAKYEQWMNEIKVAYDDVKPEDRVYDTVVEKIESFQKQAMSGAMQTKREYMDALRDKRASILEDRDRDAAAFWVAYMPKIDAAVDELDQEQANTYLREFPKKFDSSPTKQVVNDKRASVADIFNNMNPKEKIARNAVKQADEYAKNNPTDFMGQLERYQKLVTDFAGTRVAGGVNNTKIPVVRKGWEEAAQKQLAVLRDQLEKTKAEGTADAYVATMKAAETYPKNLVGAEQGDKDLAAFKADVTRAASLRWTAVDAQAKKLREGFQPQAALDAVTPWQKIYFEQTVVARSARFEQSLNRVLPMHTATEMMALVPTADDVVIGDSNDKSAWGPEQQPRAIAGFWVDVYETTNQLWYEFITDPWLHAESAEWTPDRQALIKTLPAGWTRSDAATFGIFPQGLERHPVRGVSYEQAVEFARWAGKRLPTEFEWEYAARGKEPYFTVGGRRIKMTFPWGEEPNALSWSNYANFYQDMNLASFDKMVPTVGVRTHENGKSRHYGLYEMAGNVAEWTSSSYLPYTSPRGNWEDEDFGNEHKVVRGGSFANEYAELRSCRAVVRSARLPSDHPVDVGFRCVKPEKLVAPK